MPSIESIEHKLIQLDASTFQRLGDDYFSQCANIKYKEFRPVGLAPGKRAPRKGTPDTLIELQSGKYILIEYTTKEKGQTKSAFLKKLKEDLAKCLNPKSTGIAVSKIDAVILTTNQIVAVKEKKEIVASFKARNVMIEFRDLHFWSQEVRRFSFLARTYLDLYSETKQVLAVDEFIKEYEYGGLSTPLSNTFLHREVELKNAVEAIDRNRIYVIAGVPGAGKTKIALEAASKYAQQNSVELYCLKDKGSWSLDDVRTYFFPDRRYLVLIDDANRHIRMLKSMIYTLQEGLDVRLLLTVRDYALPDVKSAFEDLKPEIHTIKVFDDKELLGIIRQVANFNRPAVNRILELAQGNPRLALMAARIVKETNTLYSVNNASDIFDKYFSSIVGEHKVFSQPKFLKPLGVISIFKSMDLSSPSLKSVLEEFKIKRGAFLEAVNVLEEMELVEMDGDLVRITDQNFQTYSFYKAFVAEKKLSISILLNTYFPQYSFQIKDIVSAANNAFGYENLFKAVYGPLISRWKKLSNDSDRIIFFEAFWYYCPTELFAFLMSHIESLPANQSDEQEEVKSYYQTSRYFRLLIPFLNYNNENFIPALELLIEFTKKCPNHYAQLLDTIKGKITYDEESYPGYKRQLKFLRLITANWKTHSVYQNLFFDCANHFFYARFTVSAGRKANTIALEQHRAILNPSLKNQRKLIWSFLYKKFRDGPSRVVKILSHYADHRIDLIEQFVAFDAPFIFQIVRDKFNESVLSHALCVFSIDHLLKRFNVGVKMPTPLTNRFLKSKTYLDYKTLSWHRDQDRLESAADFQKYRGIKSRKVISAFGKSSIDDLTKLTSDVISWHAEIESHFTEGLYDSLDVLANHFILTNQQAHAMEILKSMVVKENPGGISPYRTIASISASAVLHETFLNLLSSTSFRSSLTWYGLFINDLPRVTDPDHLIEFLHMLINREKKEIYFDFHWLKEIALHRPGVRNEILAELLMRWKSEKVKVFLSREFFGDSSMFEIDQTLLEDAYVMQYFTVVPFFDYSGESFKILMDKNDDFLISFCKRVFGEKDLRGSKDAAFIKGLGGNPQLPKLANQFLNFLAATAFLYPDDFHNSLNEAFNKTNMSFRDFLKQYLSRNAKNLSRVKLVAEIVDEVFKGESKDFLKIFLRRNDDIEHFKEINWSIIGGFFGGQTNISGLYLSRWTGVREILRDFESIKYLKHRQFVDEMIYQYEISTRKEARELFLKKSFYDD